MRLVTVKTSCASKLACRIINTILSTEGMKEVVQKENVACTGYFSCLARMVDKIILEEKRKDEQDYLL